MKSMLYHKTNREISGLSHNSSYVNTSDATCLACQRQHRIHWCNSEHRKGRIPDCSLQSFPEKAFLQRSWLTLGAVVLNTVLDNRIMNFYSTILRAFHFNKKIKEDH